jgi:beta-glucosidase-like glycosyl hydrolase
MRKYRIYGDILSLVKNGRTYVDPNEADKTVHSKEHRELALEAARKVMTLLKNRDNILPLYNRNIKKVGVFGLAASVISLGDYSEPYGGAKDKLMPGDVTPYEIMRSDVVLFGKLGGNEVVFIPF